MCGRNISQDLRESWNQIVIHSKFEVALKFVICVYISMHYASHKTHNLVHSANFMDFRYNRRQNENGRPI
jgi:hypothetical protein